jgi:hypothetical protein
VFDLIFRRKEDKSGTKFFGNPIFASPKLEEFGGGEGKERCVISILIILTIFFEEAK